MKKINALKNAVVAIAIVVMGACAVPVMAGSGLTDGINDTGLSGGTADLPTIVKTVINVILYILGILAVVFIIYGGIKYTMSGGDSAKVKSAKDTIMYAVVGLIVAILAYAIVNFAITSVN